MEHKVFTKPVHVTSWMGVFLALVAVLAAVLVPQLKHAFLANAAFNGLIVFVLAIGDFLTPQMVGGVNGFTFGRVLYSQFGTAYNWPFGAALSVMLALVVIVAILLGERFGRNRGASA